MTPSTGCDALHKVFEAVISKFITLTLTHEYPAQEQRPGLGVVVLAVAVREAQRTGEVEASAVGAPPRANLQSGGRFCFRIFPSNIHSNLARRTSSNIFHRIRTNNDHSESVNRIWTRLAETEVLGDDAV